MKVLIATDGSKHAEEAARFLSHLPHREPLELTILSVIPKIDIHGSQEMIEWKRRYADEESKRAANACKRIADLFQGANVSVESITSEGHVGTTITHHATKLGADLVVVGAIGHSALERLLVGSVSDFVATNSPCSVLVVRANEAETLEHRDLRISVAYDSSESSKFALKELEKFQMGQNTILDIVNGFASPFNYTDIPMEIDFTAIRKTIEGNLAAVADTVRGTFPKVTSHAIEVFHVGDGIVEFAREHKSDLIVVGDNGLGLFERALMGSVSRYILRHAHCAVWIARKKTLKS